MSVTSRAACDCVSVRGARSLVAAAAAAEAVARQQHHGCICCTPTTDAPCHSRRILVNARPTLRSYCRRLLGHFLFVRIAPTASRDQPDMTQPADVIRTTLHRGL